MTAGVSQGGPASGATGREARKSLMTGPDEREGRGGEGRAVRGISCGFFARDEVMRE